MRKADRVRAADRMLARDTLRIAATETGDAPAQPSAPPPGPHRLLARLAARTAFGGVLLGGAVALVAGGSQAGNSGPFRLGDLRPSAAQILVGTWLAAATLAIAVFACASLARRRTWRCSDALLEASWVVPVAGVALLLPLTIHLLVALVNGTAGANPFNGWVRLSLIVTGATHLVFAGLCVRRARQLVAGAAKVISPMRIYGLTVATSCVPFVLMVLLPPILVALTGLPILPLLFAMQRAIERERVEFARLPKPLPRAIAAVSRDRSCAA